MFSSKVNVWIFGSALLLLPTAVAACDWSDASGELRINAGICAFAEIAESETIELNGRTATAGATIRVGRGATLVIDDTDLDELRLLSTPKTRAHLIAEAATLRILDIVVRSYDPATNGPDETMEDGRSFLRVDAFLDDTGQAANGRLEIERSTLSYLGYDSRYVGLGTYSSYGVSLKVRSENDLQKATVTGHILNSTLSHNYRGFYSYGAQDFEIRDNEIHNNTDYGVDGHDDSDRLTVTGNVVHSNGGTGVICSRRCDDNVFENNKVHGNGANGIVLHDLSLGGRILNNSVYDNVQDGIVVHDSQNTQVSGNDVRGNRYGLRIFSGSVATTVSNNRFGANAEADILLKHGNLGAKSDLSDYSNGSDWNSRNIARHNSSRVWGTEVIRNTFEAPARIVARGTHYLRLARNEYTAGVSFDIRSSDNVELDGADSRGPVRYILRSESEGFAEYRIAPALGAELSMTGHDRVRLLGNRLMIPAGADFRLHLDGDGPGELAVEVARGQDIRTGILAVIPIAPVSGTATISGYRDLFATRRSVSMNISSGPSNRIRLKAFSRLCSVVKWSLGEHNFVATNDDAVEVNEPQITTLILKCLAE